MGLERLQGAVGAVVNVTVTRDVSESTWTVLVDGVPWITRESFTVAMNVAHHLEHPEAWDASESAEVAESIRKHLAKP